MESIPRTAAELARHAASMRRVAGALVRDAAEAEDVSQEALRAALERPAAARRSLGGWLAGAGRRLAAGRARGEARRRGRERDVARAEAQPSAAERAAGLEVAERLVALVRALPESQAEVVWLRFWEDLPREIATRLDIGLEAVKTRLKRGLATLRDELDAETSGGREAWLGALVPLVRVPVPFPVPPGAPPTAAETVSAASKSTPALAGWPLVLLVKKLALVALVGASIVGGYLLLDRGEVSPPELEVAAPTPRDSALVRGADSSLSVTAVEPAERTSADERESPALAAPRLAVRVVRELDGAPLPDVRVAAIERDRPALASVGRAARTDGAGRVVFGDLEPGPVRLVSDRGARLDVELGERGSTEVELAVPPGVRLTGVVLGPAGQPVSGAEVVLQRHTTVFAWTDVAVVATTGADGRFDLVDVSPEACVGARASGFAPSELDELRHRALEPGDELALTLRLGPDGGVVRGIVVGPDGAPVRGARVWIVQRSVRRTPTLLWVPSPSGALLVTGADGTFERDDLELGTAHVVVAAPGFARKATTVAVEERDVAPREVRLEPPSGIDGRVIGADGRGLAGVSVRLERVGSRYAQDYDPLDFADVRTDADGRFRLDELPSGGVVLTSFVPGVEDLSAETRLATGERAAVELRVPGGLVLAGRASEPDGTPIVGEVVFVQGPDGWKNDMNTDAEGRFRFEGVPDGPLAVHLYPLSRGWRLPAVTLEDVRAEDSPVEIVWANADRTGIVRGRFVDTGGWIRPGDRVVAQLVLGKSFSDEVEIDLADGRFRFDDVLVGQGYRVQVGARDQIVLASEVFSVEPGQSLELPEIRTEAPAGVRLELVTGDTEARASATLTDPARGLGRVLTAEDGVLADDRVPAGDWWLTLSVDGFAAEGFSLQLAPSETWERTHACVPVSTIGLRLDLPGHPTNIGYRILDTDGVLLVESGAIFGDEPFPLPTHLLPGKYVIEVHHLNRDQDFVGEFEVPIDLAESQEIVVELDPR